MAHASPAFRFYPADFLMGTMTFSLEEKGAYIAALSYQWAVGGLPAADATRLARVLQTSKRKARRIWTTLCTKFARNADGLYYNERLEAERDKQSRFSNKQASSGKKGGLQKAANRLASATAQSSLSFSSQYVHRYNKPRGYVRVCPPYLYALGKNYGACPRLLPFR